MRKTSRCTTTSTKVHWHYFVTSNSTTCSHYLKCLKQQNFSSPSHANWSSSRPWSSAHSFWPLPPLSLCQLPSETDSSATILMPSPQTLNLPDPMRRRTFSETRLAFTERSFSSTQATSWKVLVSLAVTRQLPVERHRPVDQSGQLSQACTTH